MKILYFDCFSGISGDMIVGSLLDLGINIQELKNELKKLKIKGYEVECVKTTKNGITASKFNVFVKKDNTERSFSEIIKIINDSKLKKDIKEKSIDIFTLIAKSESKIHNTKINKIHLHELGGIDTVVDVVSSLILIDKLKPDKIFCSPINLGSGFVNCRHGILPVPAPATAEILKNVPVYNSSVKEELTTPTGAAIIKSISDGFTDMPEIKIKRIGYGAGTKNLTLPNVLRTFYGETDDYSNDSVIIIETNIDDMNPQFYESLMEKLFSLGALDVFLTPVIMKKSRPGIVLNVIFKEKFFPEISDLILKETTSFGLRYKKYKRIILSRDIKKIKTRYGVIKVKVGKLNGKIIKVIPEYEYIKKLSNKFNIPVIKIYEDIKKNI